MKLFDFSEPEATRSWQAIDDRVMGGVSQSELTSITYKGNSAAAFRGEVSTRNNGGFASVRSPVISTKRAAIPTSAEHLCIRCSTTEQFVGKSYYLNLRINSGLDGVSYRVAFTPKIQTMTFEFTTADFDAVFRGRAVRDAPELTVPDVQQVGLMIADNQTGPFELLVMSIGAF